MNRVTWLSLPAVLLSANTLLAGAAVVTPFGTREEFGAYFAGIQDSSPDTILIETWDGYAGGTTISNNSTANGIKYNTSYGGSVVVTPPGKYGTTSPDKGLGGTATNYPAVDYFFPSYTVTFTFSAPLTTFAIDINTWNLQDGAFKATTSVGSVFSRHDPFYPESRGWPFGQFIGFSSDTAFTWVTISAVNQSWSSGNSYTLDTLRGVYIIEPQGSSAPIPPAVLMCSSGLLVLLLVAQRRSILRV